VPRIAASVASLGVVVCALGVNMVRYPAVSEMVKPAGEPVVSASKGGGEAARPTASRPSVADLAPKEVIKVPPKSASPAVSATFAGTSGMTGAKAPDDRVERLPVPDEAAVAPVQLQANYPTTRTP
jgi:hypothetical protein